MLHVAEVIAVAAGISVHFHFKGRAAGFRFFVQHRIEHVRNRLLSLQRTASRALGKCDLPNYHYFPGVCAATMESIAIMNAGLRAADDVPHEDRAARLMKNPGRPRAAAMRTFVGS